MVDHIYINGRFYISSRAKISINDRGFLYGDGIFETMRSYGGNVFMLFMHLERLFHSLKILKFPVTFNQAVVADAVYKTVSKSGLKGKDAYIKIIVTRGEHAGALYFDRASRCSLIIIVKRLNPYPKKLYSDGAEIISSSIKRQSIGDQVYRHKLMNYFENLYEKDRAHSVGAYESIFTTRERLVLEGSTTNIFLVRRPTVYTPPLTQNILGGITRKIVIQLCRANGIRISERKIHYRDLINADEVFLTNSVAGIIPVKKVDIYRIGNGTYNSITSRLAELYRMTIEDNCRKI